MFNGYAKMRLLHALIGRILDIHQTHQTHFRTAQVVDGIPVVSQIIVCTIPAGILVTQVASPPLGKRAVATGNARG